MAKKIRDTDYLGLSTRIRAMENSLLTRERMDQLLDARTEEEVSKLLQECGYPALDPRQPEAMDAALSQARAELWADLSDSVPDQRMLDAFRLKYDYHNGKALLKAAALGTDPASMLIDLGRIPVQDLREAVREEEWSDLPGKLGAALAEAKEILDTTRDPQLSDLALDRWAYADLLELSEESGSAFLEGYARLRIDAANLGALVRTLRMGKNADFLQNVLFPGGSVDPDAIVQVSENKGGGLADLYASAELARAAESGAEALRGGGLTEFERLLDDAANEYLSKAKFIPFGEAPLIGFLAAKETEYTNLRILLSGRAAGLPAQTIRSRLRDAYV